MATKVNKLSRKIFEIVQLGRVTRFAREFAYDAGAFRVFDLGKKAATGKLSKSEIREINLLGFRPEEIKFLNNFKSMDDAFNDAQGKIVINIAGRRSADRDALIPQIGNRRLFSQSRNPFVKFAGSFLSWAQAKATQTNSLVRRMEDGDAKLALMMVSALPIYGAVRSLQIAMNSSEEFREEHPNFLSGFENIEEVKKFIADSLLFSGQTIPFSIDKIINFLKYSGSDITESIYPIIGVINDLSGAIKTGFRGKPRTGVTRAFETVVPFGKDFTRSTEIVPEVLGLDDSLAELAKEKDSDRSLRLNFVTGGDVEGEEVPFTQENPADRINPLTGEPYSETSQGVLATLKSRQGLATGAQPLTFNQKYHKDTIELGLVMQNDRGQPVTARVEGIEYDGKIYNLPLYNRKGGFYSREEALDIYKEAIDKGLIQGYPKEFDGDIKNHPANIAARKEHKMMDADAELALKNVGFKDGKRVPKTYGGLLNNLQRRKKFALGATVAGLLTREILDQLPKTVYRGGSSRIITSKEGTSSVFATPDKIMADSFADPKSVAKSMVTDGESLKMKDKLNLHEIDISGAKNPYVLDQPSEAMKIRIERALMKEGNSDARNEALMSLLNPEDFDIRVASSDFYRVNREVGKFLKDEGYDIAIDSKTLQKGFNNNPEAELFILDSFPVKAIPRLKVKGQEIEGGDLITFKDVAKKVDEPPTVKVPTWFKETQVKTDVNPADAQKTQVGITSGTYKKVVPLLKTGNTLDFGAGLGKGAKILKADSYEPFPKKGFEPTFTETSAIPNSSYDNVVSLNVLNVVKPDVRNDIVLDIGRILKPEGIAIITTRGSDIFGNKNNITKGVLSNLEEGAIITSSGTYQKGFTNPELKEYVSGLLGDMFEVENITGLGKAGIKVTKVKPTDKRLGFFEGKEVDNSLRYKKIFNELPESLKQDKHIINVDGSDYVVDKRVTAESFKKRLSDFGTPQAYLRGLESKMKRLLEKEEGPLEKVERDVTNFLSFLTNALNPRTTINDIRYINAPYLSEREKEMLKDYKKSK